MADRVTIQDIADALGVSRNTVSKAINNTGVLADATREKVLKKAIEMGYKQFSYVNLTENGHSQVTIEVPSVQNDSQPAGVIALLTTQFLGSSHFASTMLDRVQRELSLLGYSLVIHRITEEDLQKRRLPFSLNLAQVCGIMCIEVFDTRYSEFLCSLDMPLLFVDGPVPLLGQKLPADLLLMENRSGITSFIHKMRERGKTRIGFVGEQLHCISFFERYMAYREAMFLWDMPMDEAWSITGLMEPGEYVSAQEYQDHLRLQLDRMDTLPDVFICANDFVAIDLMQVLRERQVRIPEDVYICGFDDSPESRVTTPRLTTIHIHSQIMGYSAVHLLLSRIKDPSLNYRTIYTETTLHYRESTED